MAGLRLDSLSARALWRTNDLAFEALSIKEGRQVLPATSGWNSAAKLGRYRACLRGRVRSIRSRLAERPRCIPGPNRRAAERLLLCGARTEPGVGGETRDREGVMKAVIRPP